MARVEGVFERDVGFGVHAESGPISQAHDRLETQPRQADGDGRLFAYNKAQMRGACLGHC